MDGITQKINSGLCRGAILCCRNVEKIPDGRYRVLNIRDGLVVLCQMDISSFKMNVQTTDYLFEQLYDKHISIESEDKRVVDYNQLSDYQKSLFKRNLDIVTAVEEEYGPDYLILPTKKPKPLLQALCNKYQLSDFSLRRIIRLYLQSGCDNNALLDQSLFAERKKDCYDRYTMKPGRKCETVITGKRLTSNDISYFEEALNKYKSGRNQTFVNVYDLMNNKHYSHVIEYEDGSQSVELLPASERPSFRQFTHYCSKHISREEMDRIKTSEMEQRNSKRLLLSDSRYRVKGPGDRFQMDEVEVDLSIVSSLDPTLTVGRPIVYVMYDIYSGTIPAVSISFENNSILGMTNCFLNLAQDKVEYCARYGINITREMWPSGYLPRRIITDRGSEYRSYETKRIFRELNIQREFAPAGTGSMKGLVEQWFHQMHSSQNPHLEHHGLIEKRHDSKHHKEACLTMYDFTKMLLNFVIHHNNSLLDDYPFTVDMIKEQLDPIPVKVFEYGIKKHGVPKPIANLPQYYFSLMSPQPAKYDRRGIRCNDLFYINEEDRELLTDMYNAQNKRIEFPIRMDPRDVGSVYYIRDNRIMRASLNNQKTGNADVTGMTLREWQLILKSLRARRRNLEITQQGYDSYIASINELIVENAIKLSVGVTDTSEMRKHRATEKNIQVNTLRIFDHINHYLEKQFGEGVSKDLIETSSPSDYEVIDDATEDINDTINNTPITSPPSSISTAENEEVEINIAENPAAYLAKLLSEGWRPEGMK